MLEFQKKLTNGFYALLSLPATGMGFALSIQISALSWILTTKYRLAIDEVGFVWAAGPLAGIFGQVIVGLISDNTWFWGGRRRPFVLIGGTIASAMLLALPFFNEIGGFLGISNIIIIATVVALTLDLAINISFNPTRSIIADVTPEGEARTKGYTWMQTVSGFFGVLAYIIGATIGNYVLLYVGTVIVFFFSIIPMFFITEPRSLQAVESSAESETLETTVRKQSDVKALLQIYFAHGFSWIGVQTMFVFIIAFITEKMGLTPEDSGPVIAYTFAILNTVGFLLPTLVLQPFTKKIGTAKTHTVAVGIMGTAYLLISQFATSPIVLYVLIALAGIGWASIVSLPFAIMTQKVAKEKTGLFMGIFNLSVVIPQLLVSAFVGLIIKDAPDKSVIFWISGVSLLISAALWFFVKDDSKGATVIKGGGGH